MAEITKQALKVDNNTSFPNNNAGAITPAILRAFNVNMIDSMVDEIGYNVDSASWNVSIDNIEAFTASLQTAFVSTASFNAFTSSINAYTASNNIKWNNAETATASLFTSVANLNQFTASQVNSLNELNTFSASAKISIAALNQASSSLQSFTQSANVSITNLNTTTASLNTSVSNINTFTASAAVSITNLNTNSASVNTAVSNINTFTASAAISINALNVSSASQQVSIDSLNSKTGSYATTGSNTFTSANTFTSISASSFVSASQFVGDGSKLTNITSSISLPILDEGIPVGNAVSMNFTGSAISATVVGGTAIISVDTISTSSFNSLTASFNTYTSSTNLDLAAIHQATASLQTNSASVNTSITNINSTTASLNTSVSALNTFTASQSTASLVTSIDNLNGFSASALTSISNLNQATASLFGSASLGLTTASVNVNIITFTKGNGTTFDITVAASGSVAPGTISGSAQITALGFVSSSVTASSLVTASFSGNTLTFTKGDASTFGVVIPDVSGSAGTTVIEVVYTGESITKGDPLYISGSQGANPTVFKADASNPAKMPVTFISNETIGAANTTNAIVLGLIEGIDLTGYVAGQTIYVAEGGGYSTSLPSGSNSITQLLGVITKGGSGGKGLVLNPGPAQLPGLDTGYMWVGGATNQPVEITTASFATTGSNTFTGDQTLIDNAGNFFTISDASGSMMLVAKGFTSASAHMSASAAGIGNFIFKTNSNTGDTIISGSGNIFTNPNAPTAGFKRYIGGSNNIINTIATPQISSSMAFSPTMNNNYIAGTMVMRGPVSSSTYSISTNNILGTVNIGTSAALNAEKLLSGLAMAGNNIGGTLNIVANQSALTGSTTSFNNNIIAGATTLNLSSSVIQGNNNIINDSGFTLTNQYYSSSLGLGNVAFNRNNIGGQNNSIIISGSLPVGGAQSNSISDNFIFGGTNTIYIDVANARVSGSSVYKNVVRTGLMGNNLIVSGSSLLADGSSVGSVFVGRYNADDSIRNKTSDVVFAVGTGNTTTRKTGFLIDSGSNTFVEGTFNVSGSTSLNGNLVITGSLTASLQEGFVYVGNASGITTTVSTSSLGGGTINTGSFATTGSNTFDGNQTITGSVNITGSLTTAGNMFQTTGSFNTFGNVITQQGVFTSSLAGGLEIDGIGYVGSGSAGGFFIGTTTQDLKIQNWYSSSVIGKNIVIENFSQTGSAGIHGKVALRARGDGGAVTVENTSQFRVECNSEITGSLIVSSSLTASLQQGYAWVGNSSNVSSLVATSSFGGVTFPYTGDAQISGSLGITGSVSGLPITLSVVSNTASIDMTSGNQFVLTLPSSSTTHIAAASIKAGQTINLLIKQQVGPGTGSITFAPSILFPSGLDMQATATGSAIDLVSMISFDTTNLIAANVKNLK